MSLVYPKLEPLFHADVDVGAVQSVGHFPAGERRVIAITGGRITPLGNNPLLSGHIMPLGEDWQWARPDGVLELSAHYVLELDCGDRIEVNAEGFRHGPPGVLERLMRGEDVDPSEYYFRTAVRLRTASSRPELARLNSLVIVCRAGRRAKQVCIDYFAVA